jgi:hypothetical protein
MKTIIHAIAFDPVLAFVVALFMGLVLASVFLCVCVCVGRLLDRGQDA